jgi:hypothetical protein
MVSWLTSRFRAPQSQPKKGRADPELLDGQRPNRAPGPVVVVSSVEFRLDLFEGLDARNNIC